MIKTHKHCLVSVFNKEGLLPIVKMLHQLGVVMYSTGGTADYLKLHQLPCVAIEDITGYPSILGGRVKTLHPKVFGGILARRNEIEDMNQINSYEIPEIDMVIVDLYPFEQTIQSEANEQDCIEKIDVGGVSLLRAAAKNHADVLVIADRNQYDELLHHLQSDHNTSTLAQRKHHATLAFGVTSHYDTSIHRWLNQQSTQPTFNKTINESSPLRYGENPHQQAVYYGDLSNAFDTLSGKPLSYNNLVDVEAALHLSLEINTSPTFVIVKHTNSCGVASRSTALDAWQAALACDPSSAFGGVIASNCTIDEATATAISNLFFEVLIAPDYTPEALAIITKKTTRIILKTNPNYKQETIQFKALLGGVIQQSTNLIEASDYTLVTTKPCNDSTLQDLKYAEIIVKHLKSNGISLVKNQQLIGMGCGQTSRIDALKSAIAKAEQFGFDLNGAAMASEAFFPFNDCVEIAAHHGIATIVQPGGSIKDQDSIDKANELGTTMYFSGIRHFKH